MSQQGAARLARHVGRRSAVLALLMCGAMAGGCGEAGSKAGSPVVGAFGETGMGRGEFSYPRAAVIGQRGRLYVVDKAARVQCFEPNGTYAFEWKMPESAAGKPTGLGVGPDGRIYAADTHYSRVVVFEPDGREVARFGTRGTGPGQFLLPTDVAVDPDGFIYVGEYSGNDRISKFSPRYEYLLSFGKRGTGPGELERPQGLLIGPDKSLWVADACNHRICHFSPQGEFLGTFGHSGTGAGELRFPYGLDWLSDGTLVVSEFGNNRLQRFATDGRSLGFWGSAGRGAGEVAYPWAVAVGAGDRVYVIDSGNNRVQVLAGADRAIWRTQELAQR